VTRRGVEGLIPHEPPSMLIDEVLASDQDTIVCSALVAPGNPYASAGKIRSVVCLEYMAQAIAAFSGTRAGGGRKPRIGYLIAATQLALLADALYEGDSLRIEARRVWGDTALGKFNCSVSRAGELLASASLSVYMPNGALETDVAVAQECST
jgi:predicted hotdog family 3-hydroxylacyl-ACP dehydratase